MAGNISYEIISNVGILSTNESSNWTKELNLISWNKKEPKYDLRDWSPDHTRMGKGVTLTNEEVKVLKDMLNHIDIK